MKILIPENVLQNPGLHPEELKKNMNVLGQFCGAVKVEYSCEKNETYEITKSNGEVLKLSSDGAYSSVTYPKTWIEIRG